MMHYQLQPRRVLMQLGGIALYLALQSIIGEYYTTLVLDTNRYPFLYLLIDLTSVNAEATIPTWYSTLLLFGAACLLALIAHDRWQKSDRFALHWSLLAVVFLYLSADEGAVIHEIFVEPLQARFTPTGYLAFAWQIVAVPMVILFVVLNIRFLRGLNATTRNLMILSGAVYVGGALGIETISANLWYQSGEITFTYLAVATVEELFEMLGMVLFIYTLLTYMQQISYQASLRTGSPEQANVQAETQSSAASPANPQRTFIFALVALLIGLTVGSNAILVYQSVNRTEQTELVPFYQLIVDQYTGDDVVVVHMNGAFNRDNATAVQTVRLMLNTYPDVLVLTLPENERTIAFAGESLPFDQMALGEIVRANGVSQFVIYDTLTAQLITNTLP